MEALYGHYERVFAEWRAANIDVPPCFIVVCNNTATSKLVYDHIAGFQRQRENGSAELVRGRLPLFRNFDDAGDALPRPRTLLIDSEQLESGAALDAGFRDVAKDEIERFRREVVERTGQGRRAEDFTDEELLREAMNTVGKAGRLGGETRCVVSVSMLTEGWDANTVTHVLGVRAFGTQLLCEQVVGRALRRQSYELNERGRFQVEYADVLGIPFDFTGKPTVVKPQPPSNTVTVRAVSPDRDACAIRFPRVAGYRVELPEERLTAAFDDDSTLVLTPELVGPAETVNEGIVGEGVVLTLAHTAATRLPTVAYHLARHLVETKWRDADGSPKPHLFGQLKRIALRWLRDHLVCEGGTHPAQLLYKQLGDDACERITRAIVRENIGSRPATVVLDPYNSSGSTADVHLAFRHRQGDVQHRPPPLPCEPCGVRQRLGGRVRPHRRSASQGSRLCEEPRARLHRALPLGRRGPRLPAGLHRAGGRRPRREQPAASGGGSEGPPLGRRQGEERDDGDPVGAGRQPLGRVWALAVRGTARRVQSAGGTGRGAGGATMKIHYYADTDTDTLYVELQSGPGVETREVATGLNADVDASGDVVGFDIDHAAKRFDLATLEVAALPIREYRVAMETVENAQTVTS